MNRQDKKNGSRGVEWTAAFGVYQGWTANPIKGCQHACQWLIDGQRVECYAKTLAEGLARQAYPQGFSHLRFDDAELERLLKHHTPSGIFVDSMADMLGIGVPRDWIERVIEVMRLKSEHIFFVLTKNPLRLREFSWPDNAWVGVSAPPTFAHRDIQRSYDLKSSTGRKLWYADALVDLSLVDVPVRWTSIEPLSDDFSPVLEACADSLEWAVIGAASNGRDTVQPQEAHFANVLHTLEDCGIPVFFKGNISPELADKYGGWREDWPYYGPGWERLAQQQDAAPLQQPLW